jgi:hypothetical protein
MELADLLVDQTDRPTDRADLPVDVAARVVSGRHFPGK